ncbi:MAG: FAD-dependent oxidoreductase, partial [Halorhodospira sp.]
AALTAARRGHAVTLFERDAELGGQFHLARRIPGKEEFAETLRYFRGMLDRHGVTLHLGREAEVATLAGFDAVVLASGVRPRRLALPGSDRPEVLDYPTAIRHPERVGQRVAIIGAGGIGFDVAELLTHADRPALDRDAWCAEWGVDLAVATPGGLVVPCRPEVPRRVFLLQRKRSKPGRGLGKTTGWVHRASLRQRGVETLAGCEYLAIDDAGLHIRHQGEPRLLAVDSVVVCAGQEPVRELLEPLTAGGIETHLIGGADEAAELDAKRAIEQGTRVAAAL